MQLRVSFVIGCLVVFVATQSAVAKQFELLGGQLSFDTPVQMWQSRRAPPKTDRYSLLADLASHDDRFAVRVTYGKHELKDPDLSEFLRQKVESYSKINAKMPHFRWIKHEIVTRDSRSWAEIRFSHDNDSGAHVYTRCLSCYVRGHLLEVWALTRRAAQPKQKAYVDRFIDSVQLTSKA
jgi:hypothetical protein